MTAALRDEANTAALRDKANPHRGEKDLFYLLVQAAHETGRRRLSQREVDAALGIERQA